MTAVRVHPLSLVVLLTLLPGSKPAHGQGLGGGSLFGSAPETTQPVSTLGVSTYAGLGDGTGVDAAPIDPLLGGSYYAGFLAGLSHRRRGSTHAFDAAAGTSYRYFPETRELLNLEGAGALTLDSQAGQKGRLRLTQVAQYLRFRQFGLTPVETPSSPDQLTDLPSTNPEGSATVGQPFVDLTSGVNYSQSFGARTNVSADYTYRVNLNNEWIERPQSHDARVRYQHGAGRRASWWLGTAYRWGQTGLVSGVPSIRANDFEGGLDYTRRGTTIGGSAGVTLVSRGPGENPDGASRLGHQVIGAFAVGQTLGRSWNVRADYSRRLQFVDAFPDPFASDQANGSVTGQFGRRASFTAQAGYWTGVATAVTAGPDQRADGWQTVTRVGIGVSRHSEAYAQYHYTSNEFSDAALASLPPGVLPRTNWGGVRFGLSFWAPYVH